MTRDDQDADPNSDRSRDRDDCALDREEAAERASDIERARAASFGELVDRVMAGGDTPAAMTADERALIEVAQMVRAGSRDVEIDAARARDVVEDAFRAAAGVRADGAPAPARAAASAGAASASDRRAPWPRRRFRALPWAVAGLAAAAAVALALTRPTGSRSVARPELAARYRSRPADRLIGVIPKRRAGLASDRLDTIFADRMAGYRELRLARLTGTKR